MTFILFITSILIVIAYRDRKNKALELEENSCTVLAEEYIEDDDNEQSIVLKNPKFNTSLIQSYQGCETAVNFEFRPQTWKQFIGQSEAKSRINTLKKKIDRGMKSHLFIDGIRGHGKTSFIKLFAKDINAKLIEKVGNQIDLDSLIDIINEINNSKQKNVILFIDEMDSMDSKIIKVLNPIIESFEIDKKKIKPFIFAGATINKHELIKNNPDTLDRIPTHIKFKRYNHKEISIILKQYQEQLYNDTPVSDEVIKVIAENCKFNPRTSIGLLEDYIVEKNINKVLKDWRIVTEGLNAVDIQILTTLYNAPKPMGANALALKVGLSPKEYSREYEPFLYEYNYLLRVPSRIISEKGKELLHKLKEK